MSLTLKQSEIEAFIRDPVLAAWFFFGLELDVPQRARLREMWFVPEVHDDSGIFTGKTIVSWVWVQLRCILLPSPRGFAPRIVGVFYQDMGSAKSVFKPYYDQFISSSPAFRNELSRQQGGRLGYRPLESGFEYIYKNHNRVFVPPIGMKEDAAKLASLRVHDGFIDEAKEMDGKSDALDNQILSRINADCWNKFHPVWTNHVVHVGHAEDPATHPSYKRHKVSKAKIWDGDQEVAIITCNFRDWTPKFRRFRKDKEIRTARLSMSPAKFAQRYGGIWEWGTEDWYDAKVLESCCTPLAKVLSGRDHEDSLFSAGQDTAGGGNRRSDWNALVNWRGRMLPPGSRPRDTTGLYFHNGNYWELSPVWAWQGKGKDGGQLSGLVHRGDQRFGFGRVVYDPGGGGLWVAKEFWKTDQFFDGRLHKVAGLCRPEDSGLYPQARPILVKWSKGSTDLAHAWEEPRFLVSDDGIVEAIHLKAQDLFYSQSIRWPLSPEMMPKAVLEALSPEDRQSLVYLDMTLKQLMNVKAKMTTKNGEDVALTTRQGFRSFDARGKKDLAYAALYGLAGLLSLIHDPELQVGIRDDGGGCMVSG